MLSEQGFIGFIVVGVVVFISLVVVLLTTVRAAHGQLARNSTAGIRTSATMHSDETWSAAHRAALPTMKNALGAFLGASLGASLISLALDPAQAVGFGLLIGSVVSLALVVIACVRGHRAARDLVSVTSEFE